MDKPKIGLLPLFLKMYDDTFPKLRAERTEFAKALAQELEGFAEVVFPGMVDTRESAERAYRQFATEGVDLVVLAHLTYNTSLTTLPVLLRSNIPLVIWNTQKIPSVSLEFTYQDLLENHGMHGVQDLANVLGRSGVQFGLVTGHWKDQATLAQLRDYAQAARTAHVLRRARIGIIGHQFPEMGDFGVDETMLLAQIGPRIIRAPVDAIARAFQEVADDRVETLVQEDRELFTMDESLSDEQHRRSVRLELALREIVEELKLDGFATYCPVLAEDPRIGIVPCLAASTFLGEGIMVSCEGDVTAAAALILMRELNGAANFTEMFTMDFTHDAILMSHCGQGNWRMADRDAPINLRLQPFWKGAHGAGASLVFALEPGDVTLLCLTTAPGGKIKLIATEVRVSDFPSLARLATPNFKIELNRPIGEFLNHWSRERASHHVALSYGHVADKIEKVAEIMGVEYALV